MKKFTSKTNFQFKRLFYAIIILSILILSSSLRLISAFTVNLPSYNATLFMPLNSNKISRCSESSTNLNGVKVSTYFTGKTASIQLNDDFNHMRKVSRLVGKTLAGVAVVFPTFTAAAYYNSFYDFYRKHRMIPLNTYTMKNNQ